MPMLTIRSDSPVPLEEQICHGIRQAMAQGELREGDELPSVRQLAGDLGIHWNTVGRAFRALREEGLLVVEQGKSARVAPASAARGPARESAKQFAQGLREALAQARLKGLTFKKVRELVQEELRDWQESEKNR